MTDTPTPLLPCAHCGGKAKHSTAGSCIDGRITSVQCRACGSHMIGMAALLDGRDDSVIGYWNRRTPHPDLARMREALEEAVAAWERLAVYRSAVDFGGLKKNEAHDLELWGALMYAMNVAKQNITPQGAKMLTATADALSRGLKACRAMAQSHRARSRGDDRAEQLAEAYELDAAAIQRVLDGHPLTPPPKEQQT